MEPNKEQKTLLNTPKNFGPIFIQGAPGTGKTTILIEKITQLVQQGEKLEKILLISPSRATATTLRNKIATKLTGTFTEIPSKTWSAYTFDLLKRAQNFEKTTTTFDTPQLLSGADQDVIIAEILKGHQNCHTGPQWPKSLHAALTTRGFRKEIREMFDRINELGIDLQHLQKLATQQQHPEWAAVAKLYQEYNDILSLRFPNSYDSAALIRAAILLFKRNPNFLTTEKNRFSHIVVDDLQESNPAMLELLWLLTENKNFLATLCPDNVVQGFRGSKPELLPKFTNQFSPNHKTITLKTNYRNPQKIIQGWNKVTNKIPALYAGIWRKTIPPTENTTTGQLKVHLVASDSEQKRLLSQKLLFAHLHDKHSWSDMAVIVRTGSQLNSLQRYLNACDIPVKIPLAQTPIRDENAVRPFLEILDAVLHPENLDLEKTLYLLRCSVGGVNALQLRKLKQTLRLEEKKSGGNRNSDTLLVEAIKDPNYLISLGQVGQCALRISKIIAATKETIQTKETNIEQILWTMWQTSGLAPIWQKVALETGPFAAQADQDLDAIVALFEAAQRYLDRLPGADIEQFLEYLLDQELPSDTLAARANLGETVELHTPASAASQQWSIVIIVGLQEKVWPNLRIRGDLLAVTELVDVFENQKRDHTSIIRDIWFDELRTFSVAISRAKQELSCIAVVSETEQPSVFCQILQDNIFVENKLTVVENTLNLREIVAKLRQILQNETSPVSAKLEAAQHLAKLSAQNIVGAHPKDWWGLLPLSSTKPIREANELVTVSPSKIEQAQKCPLCWFIGEAKGNYNVQPWQHVGTLIHEIVSKFENTNLENMLDILGQRWKQLALFTGWQNEKYLNEAKKMLHFYVQYVKIMQNSGRQLLAVEVPFSVQIGAAVLGGQIDRIEKDSTGNLFIVDFKTGKNKPTKNEIAKNPQLAAYQAASNAAAFKKTFPETNNAVSAGAALVQLGDKTVNVSVQTQDKISPKDTWILETIAETAKLMSAASFTAQHPQTHQHTQTCQVPQVCPLCPQGRQITQ